MKFEGVIKRAAATAWDIHADASRNWGLSLDGHHLNGPDDVDDEVVDGSAETEQPVVDFLTEQPGTMWWQASHEWQQGRRPAVSV